MNIINLFLNLANLFGNILLINSRIFFTTFWVPDLLLFQWSILMSSRVFQISLCTLKKTTKRTIHKFTYMSCMCLCTKYYTKWITVYSSVKAKAVTRLVNKEWTTIWHNNNNGLYSRISRSLITNVTNTLKILCKTV